MTAGPFFICGRRSPGHSCHHTGPAWYTISGRPNVNHLLIGAADKTERLLEMTKPRFLLIDDGPIADCFLERFPKARLFDPAVHSFNPLAGMDYKRARDFAETIYSASPGGRDTLTVRNGKRALVRILLAHRGSLGTLQASEDAEDDADKEALAMIEDLLISPVLRGVLCASGKPFKFGEGTTVAKLDRAELGEFDAFVLGSLLIGQHQGQVVVPDFGFFGRPLHVSLIRQDRLTAGLHFLDEVPKQLRQELLLIDDKQGAGCTLDDAKVLADYKGLIPDPTRADNLYNQFVQRTMKQTPA